MSTPTTPPVDLTAFLSGTNAPRAALVTLEGNDLKVQAVAYGCSVVNLNEDLTSHLSASPFSDEFLVDLRDYCEARLQARAAARAGGGVAVPGIGKTWAVLPRPGLQKLEVR